jgi:hypothetical protein
MMNEQSKILTGYCPQQDVLWPEAKMNTKEPGGMNRKMSVISMGSANFVILDESTTSLDPFSRCEN